MSRRIPTSRTRAAAGVATTLLAGAMACAPAQAAGSLRAAYVEQVIPSRTYATTVGIGTLGAAQLDVSGGVLGITSLVITNYSSSTQRVLLIQPRTTDAASCNQQGLETTGNTGMRTSMIVQANATLQLTFPTPLTFNPVNGQVCVLFLAGGSSPTDLNVDVNGLLN